MPIAHQFQLHRSNMHNPVQQSNGPGVRVVLACQPSGWVGLVADSAENTGVSATNGVLEYMNHAAQLVGVSSREIAWLERDTLGRIDQVLYDEESTHFQAWVAACDVEEQIEKLLPLFGRATEMALRWALIPN